MKADSPLKKHHFWILFGVAPLLTLIGVLIVSSSVGGEIAKREGEIDAADKAIGSKSKPKPESLIKEASKLVDRVSKKQGELHQVNWENQKGLFTWPTGVSSVAVSQGLRKFNALDLKFGAPLPTGENEFEVFKRQDVYLNEFESVNKDGTGMADKVYPTQFRGGWRTILRHVNNFDNTRLTNDQVWLLMEDVWVQRSLLDPIRVVNAELAAFRRAKKTPEGEIVVDESYDEKGNKLEMDPASGKPVVEKKPDGTVAYKTTETPVAEKREGWFRNRIWAVELKLVTENSVTRLTGTLTNLSPRLQLMGVGNVMTLNVRFTRTQAAPFEFKIGGEYVPGKGARKFDNTGRDIGPGNVLPIVPIEDHVLPAVPAIEEIVSVEQVFDIRTVPVKRIEAMALGFADARSAGKPLVGPNPPFQQEKVVEASSSDGDLGGSGKMGGLGAPPGVGGSAGGTGGNNNAAQGKLMGGGTLATVVDANKKRYLADGVNAQVRRMPVGVVVVVDQSYVQDMLLAYANSPLRFQTTQVGWTRFYGTLTGVTASSSGIGGGSDISSSSQEGSGIPAPGPGPGGFGSGSGSFRPPSGGPMGASGPGGGGGPPPPPRPGGVGGPGSGSIGGPGSGFPGFGSSAVSDSQITAGLVELSIYGTVSLYEKYEAPKPADGATAGTGTPSGTGMGTGMGEPGMGTGMPTTPPAPAPMQPMTPTPPAPAPKPRRRRA